MKKRFPHKLHKSSKTEMPSYLLFFDTETFPDIKVEKTDDEMLKVTTATGWTKKEFDEGKSIEKEVFYVSEDTFPHVRLKKAERHIFKMCSAYKWSRKDDKEGRLIKKKAFYNLPEFWQWIDENTLDKTKTYVFTHNLGFDYRVSKGDDFLPQLGWTEKKPFRGHGTWLDTWRKDKKSLQFTDVFNFFKNSVADIGESINVPKLKRPNKNSSWQYLEKYCLRDTEIIYEAIKSLLKWIEEEDLGCFQPTIASLALSIYRYKFNHGNIEIHANDKATQLEIDAYRGGWSEAFYLGKVPENPVYYLDVQSMYPSVMLNNYYPIRLQKHINHPSLSFLQKKMEQYLVIARVKCKINERSIGKRDERLLFPIGYIQETLTTPELEEVLKNGTIFEVEEMTWYSYDRIFKEFVDYIWKKRKAAKEREDKVSSWFFKIVMNSLYGKFGQRSRERVDLDFTEGNMKEEGSVFIDGNTKRAYPVYNYGGIQCYWGNKEPSFDSFIAIPAFVTAYARIKMLEYFRKAGVGNVYYTDTDGMFVNSKGRENLKEEIKPKTIGKLEEKIEEDLVIKDVKRYSTKRLNKNKGVPKKAKEISKNTFQYYRFEGYHEALLSGHNEGVWLIEEEKVLSTNYKKAEKGKDGWTTPFLWRDFQIAS